MTTHDDSNVDREAILARRALFISAALATLSCGPGRGTEAPVEPRPVDDPPRPKPVDPPPPNADAPPPAVDAPLEHTLDLDRLPAWSVVVGRAPPRDVPPGLPPADAEALTRLADEVGPLYDRLERLWSEVPRICALSEADCEAAWEAFARELALVDTGVGGLMPLCGFSDTARTILVQRTGFHNRFLREQVAWLREAVTHGFEQRGPQAVAAFSVLGNSVAVGMPCLSCIGTAGMVVSSVAVPFGAMSTMVESSGPRDIVHLLAQELLRRPDVVLEIRGHGDASEGAAAEQLAGARAEAVKGELVALGVDAARLVVQTYGSRLAVDTAQTEAGRSHNRRVDFEVQR
ncbi:MAG: OmpA family protein [Deltaproteobacteria bacterium]|nr:OmpA family protein [Deltaproteobacteria bacterium]